MIDESCAIAAKIDIAMSKRALTALIDNRIAEHAASRVRARNSGEHRLRACTPQKFSDYTRERRRPALRVYFTGLRFGSIFRIPAPLFTSMI